jgi:hypothetical protein
VYQNVGADADKTDVSFLDVHYAQDANGEPAMFVVLHKTRLLVLTEFFMEVSVRYCLQSCIALASQDVAKARLCRGLCGQAYRQ